MANGDYAWIAVGLMGVALLVTTVTSSPVPGAGYIFELPGYGAMVLIGGYLALGGAN